MMEENRFCFKCEAIVSIGTREMVEERWLEKIDN